MHKKLGHQMLGAWFSLGFAMLRLLHCTESAKLGQHTVVQACPSNFVQVHMEELGTKRLQVRTAGVTRTRQPKPSKT